PCQYLNRSQQRQTLDRQGLRRTDAQQPMRPLSRLLESNYSECFLSVALNRNRWIGHSQGGLSPQRERGRRAASQRPPRTRLGLRGGWIWANELTSLQF